MAQKLDYTAEQINVFLSKISQLETTVSNLSKQVEDLNSEVTGVEAILAEV